VVNHTIQLGNGKIDEFGLFDAGGAMNEGLADYFAAAISGDPSMAEYAITEFDSSAKFMRNLDNTGACPAMITGQVHFDSTLFSGGLWSVRAKLADDATREKFDAAIYKAMRTNPGRISVGYEDVVKLFLATLGTDLPAAKPLVEAEMTKRGVLPICRRVLEFKDKPVMPPVFQVGPGGQAAYLGFAAYPAQQGLNPAPSMIQIKYELPANTAKVTVTMKDMARAGGGGGGGGFGGGGTFTPVLLAKFGEHIKWTPAGKSDATVTAKVTKSATTMTAEIEVPEGATSVFVQVGNTGEAEGRFGEISFATTPRDPGDNPGDPGNPAGGNEPPAGDSTVKAGCGCSVPSSSAPAGGIFAALAGALALVLRRRRS
jgi:MYXO-CTERM domain-containing protein